MIKYKNSPIAIIDSGIGGLALLKSLSKKYPNENYIYLADNQYMPYGNKSTRFIKNRLLDLVNYLYNTFNVKLVILGCNTASVSGLDHLKKTAPVKVVGLNLTQLDLIKSRCNEVIMNYDNDSKSLADDYVILCTKLSSKGYERLNTHNCKNLAQYIEENYFDKVALRRKIKNIMLKVSPNNIVLGCTHYELVYKQFTDVSSKNFVLPCQEFVKTLQLDILTTNSNEGDILMIATAPTKSYIDRLWKIFKA